MTSHVTVHNSHSHTAHSQRETLDAMAWLLFSLCPWSFGLSRIRLPPIRDPSCPCEVSRDAPRSSMCSSSDSSIERQLLCHGIHVTFMWSSCQRKRWLNSCHVVTDLRLPSSSAWRSLLCKPRSIILHIWYYPDDCVIHLGGGFMPVSCTALYTEYKSGNNLYKVPNPAPAKASFLSDELHHRFRLSAMLTRRCRSKQGDQRQSQKWTPQAETGLTSDSELGKKKAVAEKWWGYPLNRIGHS